MKGFIAVLAVALAVPAGALAADVDVRVAQQGQLRHGSLAVLPPDLRAPALRTPNLHTPDQRTVGTPGPSSDLRAPDQRDRPTGPVSAKGTDVAAPDRQVRVSYPRAIVPTSSAHPADGTDWGDAGLGAAGALGLAAIALGAGMTFRRRTTRRTSALAG